MFGVARVLFFLFNKSYFPTSGSLELLEMCFYGLRFDLAAVIYTNSLFIVLSLLPVNLRSTSRYLALQLIVFVLTNGYALQLEVNDMEFFKYANRRTTFADYGMVKTDLWHLLGQLLIEFWYIPVLIIIFLRALFFVFHKTNKKEKPRLRFLPQMLIFLLGCGLALIGLRGGLQARPLSMLSAAEYVDNQVFAQLVGNTTLNFIFSIQQEKIQEVSYFDPKTLDTLYSLKHTPSGGGHFAPKNVVIIVMESFGKEYIGRYNNGKGYTPFLDSLLAEGLTTTESYANATRSAQGVVAISASIPALMEAPLQFSAYQGNLVKGLAALLKEKNYRTYFFHGANTGSMDFEKFGKASGFDDYFDRTDYGSDKDYDGTWGVWDVPFFQYAAQKLSETPAPFFAFFFSLTSHHPYATESWFEEKHPQLDPLYRSVLYSDEALRRFFATAAAMPWYKNTLFVVVADHTGMSRNMSYQNRKGQFEIPILFFSPDDERLKQKKLPIVCQQIDIMPSILDYLGYDQPYIAFGKSIFSKDSARYAFVYHDGQYQIASKGHLLLRDQTQNIGYYDLKNDPFLSNNILLNPQKDEFETLEDQLKAVIQAHNKAMIHNELTIK